MTLDTRDYKAIEYEVRDDLAIITLNRPHRMNAWTGRMHTEYRSAMLNAENNKAVRVIIVTGKGKAFCVGADARALDGHIEKGGYDPGTPEDLAKPGYGIRSEFDTNFAWHFGLSKPVIAAINGAAAGVGLVLACYADIRFAVKGAKLTTAHGKLNLPAEYGLSWVLPRLIGVTHANDMLLSSRIVMTEEAERLNLINRLCEPEELMPVALAYAQDMAIRVSPGSLRETKRQIYTDLHRDVGSSVDDSEELLRHMMKEPHFREGVAALNEKRDPDWKSIGEPDE